MRLQIFIVIFLLFCVCDKYINGFPSLPTLPSLSNLAMIKRLIKFYTLQSKSDRSELCEKQSELLYEGVLNSKPWALRIIDASAKLPNGIMKIHQSDVGYFDECIQVHNEEISIKGKYCLTSLKIPEKFYTKELNLYFQNQTYAEQLFEPIPFVGDNPYLEQLQFLWAICVPDGCSAEDVENHLNTFAGIKIFEVDDSNCQTIDTYKSKLNAGDWVVIVGLIILFGIIILSTCYDLYLYYIKTETYHPILIAFSWFTNYQKLMKTSNNPDMLPCLNGIRFISMLWIIVGHQYTLAPTVICANLLDSNKWLQSFSSMWIMGATVSVDTFFLLSGCLLMYGFLKAQAKKIPFNIPLFYLHRYLRLTPSYVAAIIFMVTLYRFLGSGPLWDPENINEPCKSNWWSALLYIQNYVTDGLKTCLPQTWYLQIDMQLYILAPLLLVPINKWPKITVYLLSTLVLIFIVIPTIVAWNYKLAASMALRGEGLRNDEQLDLYYNKTHTRAGPWFLGMMLGYFIFSVKKKDIIPLDRIFITLLWIISFATMLYVVFGFYPETQPGYEYDRLYNALFIGLHRVAWSAGLSWIIFACVFGYGGPVNWFLSLPIFEVLSKLTYSMYLTHAPLMVIRQQSLQMPYLFSDMNVWHDFCATLLNVMIISFVWTLTFESPFAVINSVLIKSISGRTSMDKIKKATPLERPQV